MKRFLSISLLLLTALGEGRPDRLRAAMPAPQGREIAREDDARCSAVAMNEYRLRVVIDMLAAPLRVEGDRTGEMIGEMALPRQKRPAPQPAQSGRGAPAKSRGSDNKKSAPRPAPLSFRWPTAGRRIVEAYGERNNPETGTVTINPGINIGATLGSTVTAAEDGTVSLISWLPSYGTIVIVEHRGGYRTVYGNLATATISRGAIVDAGDRIGTVGVTFGGSFLHFEVWKGQTRLNPMTVLKRG